jgi:hypothetical protein
MNEYLKVRQGRGTNLELFNFSFIIKHSSDKPPWLSNAVLKVLHFTGKLLPLLVNIRLGWMWVAVTNGTSLLQYRIEQCILDTNVGKQLS